MKGAGGDSVRFGFEFNMVLGGLHPLALMYRET